MPVRYCDRFERRDRVWRIAHRRVAWEQGRIDTLARTPSRSAPAGAAAFEPPHSDGARDLEQLEAESEIRRALALYCRAVDRGDLELLKDCYPPDGHDERPGFSGGADALAEHLRSEWIEPSEWTMHFLGSQLVAVDGRSATAETYCLELAHLREHDQAPPRDLVRPVRYLDQLSLRDGRWRIEHRLVIREAAYEGPTSTVVPLSPAHASGARDKRDPAYKRAHDEQHGGGSDG
jgi:hypothetical protein